MTNWADTVASFNIPIRSVSSAGFNSITNFYSFPNTAGKNISPEIESSHMSRYFSSQSDTTFVQFIVQWYGNYELYVDRIEVLDNIIWGKYVDNQSQVITNIQTQVNSFADWDQTKLKYFYAADEPSTIDSYIPYKTVQAIAGWLWRQTFNHCVSSVG